MKLVGDTLVTGEVHICPHQSCERSYDKEERVFEQKIDIAFCSSQHLFVRLNIINEITGAIIEVTEIGSPMVRPIAFRLIATFLTKTKKAGVSPVGDKHERGKSGDCEGYRHLAPYP